MGELRSSHWGGSVEHLKGENLQACLPGSEALSTHRVPGGD